MGYSPPLKNSPSPESAQAAQGDVFAPRQLTAGKGEETPGRNIVETSSFRAGVRVPSRLSYRCLNSIWDREAQHEDHMRLTLNRVPAELGHLGDPAPGLGSMTEFVLLFSKLELLSSTLRSRAVLRSSSFHIFTKNHGGEQGGFRAFALPGFFERTVS
jgi:hypothetical protein